MPFLVNNQRWAELGTRLFAREPLGDDEMIMKDEPSDAPGADVLVGCWLAGLVGSG